jgi:hypothetical protein
MILLAQVTELADKGQTFADRFGWAPLMLIIMVLGLGYAAWKIGVAVFNWGDKIVVSQIEYVNATKEQQEKLACANTEIAKAMHEQQEKLTSAMIGIASAQTACIAESSKTNQQVDRMLDAMRIGIEIALDVCEETGNESLKTKLHHVQTALME